jgi:hypothetical protein
MPEVAAGLAAAALTFIGILATLFGLIGSKPTIVSDSLIESPSPMLGAEFDSASSTFLGTCWLALQVKKTTVKASAPTVAQAKTEKDEAPVALAGEDKKEDGAVKKRATRSTKE